MEALRQSDTIAAPVVPRQRPCPLRRYAPAPPKGEPWALRDAKASPYGRGGCEADGEGKPGRTELPCSDKQALCQSDTIAVPVVPRQRPCPLRRYAPAPPKGEPWALRDAKASPYGRGGCEADGEGKPGRTELPCSDKQALRQSDTIAVPVIPRQRPCPLRRCAPRPGCGFQRLLRCRLHPAGRCPDSSSLFPPLAAVVAVAPKGGAFTQNKNRPIAENTTMERRYSGNA